MKKFLFALFFILIMNISRCAYAYEFEVISNDSAAKIQDQISRIGFRILNANAIDKRMVFFYDTSKTLNAYTTHRDRQIVLYRGLYNMMNTDDEIAAVLSHEISHGVDGYQGIFRGYFTHIANSLNPKKYEYKADKRAVDFMVKAGYHPVALIVVMNKAFPQARYDWYSTHPLSSRRMIEVYAYIYKKYPEYLVNNPYEKEVFYQNFLLNSKQNKEKFQKSVESKSKGHVNYL